MPVNFYLPVPENSPVIIGVPPPAGSIHSRGRRKFLDAKKTEDREGPLRQGAASKSITDPKAPLEETQPNMKGSRKGKGRVVFPTFTPVSSEEVLSRRPSIEPEDRSWGDGCSMDEGESGLAPNPDALDQRASNESLPQQVPEEAVKLVSGTLEKGGDLISRKVHALSLWLISHPVTQDKEEERICFEGMFNCKKI